MFLPDEPENDFDVVPQLLEDYKAKRVRLVAQARELERLRQQVRGSAEREAAAIVTAARRDVRQVLLEARRELLVLVAQLQAVGCDTKASDLPKDVVQGEATSELIAASPVPDPLATAGSRDGVPPAAGSQEIVGGSRRDVREVLLEAQAELVALAEEARELRARIAQQHLVDPDAESFPPEAGVPEELDPAFDTPPPVLVESAELGESAEPSERVELSESLELSERFELDESLDPSESVELSERVELDESEEAAPPEYSSLSSPPQVRIAIAAAVAFVALGSVLFLFFNGRSGSAKPPASQARSAGVSQPSSEAPKPAAAAAATSVQDPSVVSLLIEARRSAWIRTVIDGRGDTGRVFKAGETRKVTARRDIVMRAGDAGAILVSVNGSEPRPFGASGMAVTRRFTPPQGAGRSRPVTVRAENGNGSADPPDIIEKPPVDIGTTGRTDPSSGPPSQGGALLTQNPAATATEREILRATQRWFEAYFGGDRAAMAQIATDDFSIIDQRGEAQRIAPTMADVDRSLQGVRIEVAGDGAVMSARLAERANVSGQARQYLSLVSGVWIRRDGRWRLMGVRFIDPANVGFNQQ